MGTRSNAQWALVALAAWGASCGGGDRAPTRPTVAATPVPGLPAGSTLSVVSAESGAPLGGVTVTVAGRAYTADAGGRVRLDQAAEIGAFIDLVAPGMLDRQTLLRSADTTFSLWPRRTATGVDENYTAILVYTSGSGADAATGSTALLRLAEGTSAVTLVPSAELLGDQEAHHAQATAAANTTAANGGGVRYGLARQAPAGGISFDLSANPGDEGCEDRVLAFTQLQVRRNEIVGGRIVYCSMGDARDPAIATHEVGHTFGLQHSPSSRDVMHATYEPESRGDFGPAESTIMRLMSQRRGGNRFPDSDRGAGAASFDGVITIPRPRR